MTDDDLHELHMWPRQKQMSRSIKEISEQGQDQDLETWEQNRRSEGYKILVQILCKKLA